MVRLAAFFPQQAVIVIFGDISYLFTEVEKEGPYEKQRFLLVVNNIVRNSLEPPPHQAMHVRPLQCVKRLF